MPICRLHGKAGKDEVRNCLRAGGMAVAFRTEPQYEAHLKLLAEINQDRAPDEKAFVYTLVLDEADKFFGDGKAKHSHQLETMLGLRGAQQANLPVLMVAVSATNVGTSYFLSSDARASARPRLPGGRGPDVLQASGGWEVPQQDGFLSPSGRGTRGRATGRRILQRSDRPHFGSCMGRPYSVLLDTSCVRVNVGVEHNMLDHVEEIVRNIPVDQRAPMIVVYVHGGHTTHEGMLGIEALCEDGLEDGDCLLEKLKAAMRELSDEEQGLAEELEANGANPRDVADARRMAEVLAEAAETLGYNPDTGCIEAHQLTELGWAVRRKANRLGYFKDAQVLGLDAPPGSFNRDAGVGRSPWSTKHLPLLLFILRKFVGEDIPIAVVGAGMIKRSMSVVAVDVFRPKISVELDGPEFAHFVGQPKCLALITDQIHTRCANSSDGAQMAARCRATLTNFDTAHPELLVLNERGEKCVREIVVADLSEAIDGHCAYNAMQVWQEPLEQRKETMERIYRATTANERRRTIANFRNQLLVTDEQREWFDALLEQVRAAEDVGDAISDVEHMVALACALAWCVELPESVRAGPASQEPALPVGLRRSGARPGQPARKPVRYQAGHKPPPSVTRSSSAAAAAAAVPLARPLSP